MFSLEFNKKMNYQQEWLQYFENKVKLFVLLSLKMKISTLAYVQCASLLHKVISEFLIPLAFDIDSKGNDICSLGGVLMVCVWNKRMFTCMEDG